MIFTGMPIQQNNFKGRPLLGVGKGKVGENPKSLAFETASQAFLFGRPE